MDPTLSRPEEFRADRAFGEARAGARRKVYGVLVSLAIAGCGLFLLVGRSREFAMDDAYIHFTYARNLVQFGDLVFNAREFRGIGTTSILWTGLLAGGLLLGVHVFVSAKVLGILFFAVAAVCVYELTQPLFTFQSAWSPDRGAFVAAVLFLLSGNMIWFALSGMETTLFLALGLLALVAYQRQRWAWVGLLLGLTVLARPEGLGLVGVLGMLEVINLRRDRPIPWRQWALAAGLCLLLAAPWFAFVRMRTGHWLPTTFAGKKLHHADAVDHFLSKIPVLSRTHSRQLFFLILWVAYALLYVFGGASFPGPALTFGEGIGSGAVAVHLSYLGLALFVTLVLPLLALGLRQAIRFARQAGSQGSVERAAWGLLLWVAVHNLAYFLLLPSPGTGTRYQAINHLFLWLLIALGWWALGNRLSLRVGAAVGIALLAGGDVYYWAGVNRANLDHMERVRVSAGRYIHRELPAEAVVAAYDIGALKFYGQRRIVDLGGLTDAQFTRYQREHRLDEYLRQQGVTYLAIPSQHSLDEKPLYDFLHYLNLDASPLYDLVLIRAFENDRAVWARGVQATGNYQPSVRLYRLAWRQPD